LSAEALAASSVVVFTAFFVRGVSGFGSATVAIPLLAQAIELRLAVPLLLVHDLLSTLATVTIDRRAVERREIVRLLPPSLAGVIFGVTLLVSLPAAPLLAALGVLVIIFGARTFASPHAGGPVSPLWALPAGFAGGALGGAFGSGAATPTMIYLTRRLADKSRVRGTFSAFAILDYTFRAITFAVTGLLLNRDLVVLVAVTLPAMALGFYLGNRLHGRISSERAFKVIGALLVVSGLALLRKAAA